MYFTQDPTYYPLPWVINIAPGDSQNDHRKTHEDDVGGGNQLV